MYQSALNSCLRCFVQFVCIAQQDYCCILNQVEKNMQKVEEEGEIVMVKEHRELDRTGTRKGHIVIKVTNLHSVIYISLKRKNKIRGSQKETRVDKQIITRRYLKRSLQANYLA